MAAKVTIFIADFDNLSLFYHRIWTNWSNFLGLVAMSPFFEALSNAHKKNQKKLILSPLNMNFGLYLFLCIALYLLVALTRRMRSTEEGVLN